MWDKEHQIIKYTKTNFIFSTILFVKILVFLKGSIPSYLGIYWSNSSFGLYQWFNDPSENIDNLLAYFIHNTYLKYP